MRNLLLKISALLLAGTALSGCSALDRIEIVRGDHIRLSVPQAMPDRCEVVTAARGW